MFTQYLKHKNGERETQIQRKKKMPRRLSSGASCTAIIAAATAIIAAATAIIAAATAIIAAA
jgi:hypothetical protein